MENKLWTLAVEAGRYVVKNNQDPSPGNITEEKESELEEFIDYSKIIMGTLGYNVFEPLTERVESSESSSDEQGLLLLLKLKSRQSGDLIEASCRQTTEGFVVLKGSRIETIDSDSIPIGIKEHRRKALIDDNNILQENLLFRSPSYAAAFVIGGHVNGLAAWKTEDGTSLKKIESLEK